MAVSRLFNRYHRFQIGLGHAEQLHLGLGCQHLLEFWRPQVHAGGELVVNADACARASVLACLMASRSAVVCATLSRM